MTEQPGTADPGQRPEEQVGSVAEEAGKLFGALSDWARDQASGDGAGAGLGEGLAGFADHAARAARAAREARAAEAAEAGPAGHGLDEHLTTGSPECTWCPVCRVVHAVRQTSPEVRAHLVSAASSLLQAAAGVLATAVPDEGRAGGRRPGVERIDLEDDHEGADPDRDDEQGGRQGWPEEDE